MGVSIIKGDITQMECDAIVNAAKPSLLGGGGVDGAIHNAAGIGLLFECMKLRGCKTGQAKITGGHKLSCNYVIHAVGPRWKGGNHGEQELLTSCYNEAMRLAVEYQCQSVAFPLISAGIYGYPVEQAAWIAVNTIQAWQQQYDMQVYLVIYDDDTYVNVWQSLQGI